MNRAIIMEVTSRHWIVMTRNGQFKKVAKRQHHIGIGDEIQLSPYWQQRSFISAAIACVLLSIFIVSSFAGGWFTNGNIVAAYVSIDVNPSIELGIDHKARVVETIGINSSGKKLLDTVGDLKGMRADEAAKKIFQSAMVTELLRPYIERGEGNVVITSTVVTDELGKFNETVITENMIAEIQEVFSASDAAVQGQVAVTNLYTPREIREEARKHGVSAGKMAIKLLSIEHGHPLEWEDLQSKAMAQIAEELGGWDQLIASEQEITKDHLRELYNLQMQKMVNKPDVQASNSDTTHPPNSSDELDQAPQPSESEQELHSSNRQTHQGLPALVWQSEFDKWETSIEAAMMDLEAFRNHPGRGKGLVKQVLDDMEDLIEPKAATELSVNRRFLKDHHFEWDYLFQNWRFDKKDDRNDESDNKQKESRFTKSPFKDESKQEKRQNEGENKHKDREKQRERESKHKDREKQRERESKQEDREKQRERESKQEDREKQRERESKQEDREKQRERESKQEDREKQRDRESKQEDREKQRQHEKQKERKRQGENKNGQKQNERKHDGREHPRGPNND